MVNHITPSHTKRPKSDAPSAGVEGSGHSLAGIMALDASTGLILRW